MASDCLSDGGLQRFDLADDDAVNRVGTNGNKSTCKMKKIRKATDLCIEIVFGREDRIMEEKLESFLYVVVTEVFKRCTRRSAAVRRVTKPRCIDDHDGRHHAVVGRQRTETRAV